MKIILTQATAENNIGTTDVPILTTIESQAYFDAIQPLYDTWTTPQKLAVNSLFDVLVEESIYDSVLSNLYLPLIGETYGWVNMINPSESLAMPASGYATYDTNGVTFLQGYLTGITISDEQHTKLFYNTTAETASANRVTIGNNTISTGWLGRQVGTGVAGYTYDNSNRVVTATAGVVESTGLMVGVNDKANSKLKAFVDAEFIEKDLTLGSGSIPVVFGNQNADENLKTPVGAHAIIGVGSGSATDEQILSIKTAIEDILDVFI